MASAITITSVSILTSQIRTNRNQTVTGAAKLAAEELDGDKIDGWLENGKDADYAIAFAGLQNVLENTPPVRN